MKTGKKLLVVLLLIVGTLVFVDAFVQNITINYPNGLALSLLGFIFWNCSEEDEPKQTPKKGE